MVISWPSWSTSPTSVVHESAPTSRVCAPHTAGRPRPRAITAAWLPMPPREVTTPATTDRAGSSAGEVSVVTRITDRPSSTTSSARQASNTATPRATPGETARPTPNELPASAARTGLVVSAGMDDRLDVGHADQFQGGVGVEGIDRVGDPDHDLVEPSRALVGQARRSRRYPTSSSMGTRSCSIESRSRTVTAWSSSESKSTVTQYGVPSSSWRR